MENENFEIDRLNRESLHCKLDDWKFTREDELNGEKFAILGAFLGKKVARPKKKKKEKAFWNFEGMKKRDRLKTIFHVHKNNAEYDQ